MIRSLRLKAGALLYDWPRYRRAMRSGDWLGIINRNERIERDGRGVRCLWEFTSDLHIAKVFPSTGARLMQAAFAEWPIALAETPRSLSDSPDVTFVIGHRGVERLPHLLATLRSIAGQAGAGIECVVVEQSYEPQIAVPAWVRYVHTKTPSPDYDYNRAWTLNAGSEAARGGIVILHDNDMLVPERYAAEVLARAREGHEFLDLKRFTFYLSEEETKRFFATSALRTDVPTTIVQNLNGASVAASRRAYFAIGGFDEEFVGWGGEDNEFWERAQTRGTSYQFGYLPFVHLFHAPQKGKLQGRDAPAIRRYHELRAIPPEERIRRLTRR